MRNYDTGGTFNTCVTYLGVVMGAAKKVNNAKNDAASLKPRKRSSKSNITEAAIRLFESEGAQNVSMEDIAIGAGVSRKTLYRVFNDRLDLIERILNIRFTDLSSKMRKKMSTITDIEEALVECSAYAVTIGLRDKLIRNIVEHETDHRLDQFLMAGNEGILQGLGEIWFPVLDTGREEGRVRDNLSNRRIIEIIVGMHAFLLMRDDYGRKERRAFLQDVLVPAILK